VLVSQLPTFTLGFNITTLVYFLAAFTFKFIPIDNAAILPTSQLPGPASFLAGSLTIDGLKFVQGAFIGVGQVFFCSHYLTSICVLIGVFFLDSIHFQSVYSLFRLCSRNVLMLTLISCGRAAVFHRRRGCRFVGGSQCKCMSYSSTALFTVFRFSNFGSALQEIYFGLWGYNSVLAGLSVFVLLKVNSSRQLISLACIGVFTAAILFSALRSFVAYWGVPVFTFPFCAAGLMLMALQPSFDRAAVRELRRKHKAVREQRASENSDQSQSTTGSEGESELAIHVNPLFVDANAAPPQEIDRV
jgi:urea transporter